MSKKGQHENDHHDPRKSSGHNNPDKSTMNDWNPDHRKQPNHDGATRAREVRGGRSGSDSNADRGSKG